MSENRIRTTLFLQVLYILMENDCNCIRKNYPGILYSHTKVPKRRLKVCESNAAAPVISYPHTKKLKMLARKCIRVVILLHLCHIFTQNEQGEEKVVIL